MSLEALVIVATAVGAHGLSFEKASTATYRSERETHSHTA